MSGSCARASLAARHRDRQRRDPPPRSSLLRRGSRLPVIRPVSGRYRFESSAARPQCGLVRRPHPRLPGRRTRRGEFADRAGVITLSMSGSCARASLARATARHHFPATPRSTPQQSLLRRGRCRSSSDRSRTGNYRLSPPDEAAVRPRPAATGDHPRLPGRRTRRGEFADREAPVAMSGGCARASLARAQLPDHDRQRRDPRRSSHCGVDAALPVLIRQVSNR